MFTDAQAVKYELDILDKMIDLVQRKIHANSTMMGMVNGAYEYDTFTGYKVDETELQKARDNAKVLGLLLDYRSALMNYALKGGTEPELITDDLPEGFSF